jgi:prophage regulatory protein
MTEVIAFVELERLARLGGQGHLPATEHPYERHDPILLLCNAFDHTSSVIYILHLVREASMRAVEERRSTFREFAMKFLSKKAVSEKIGLSRTEISRKEAAGKFPKRVQIGFRVFWVEEEVEAWMEALVARRNTASAPQPNEITAD